MVAMLTGSSTSFRPEVRSSGRSSWTTAHTALPARPLVIGNDRDLHSSSPVRVAETEKLQANARRPIRRQARRPATNRPPPIMTPRARRTTLVTPRRSLVPSASPTAAQASAQARAAVETNALGLQKQLAERTKLLSQLDQAKMQEQLNRAMAGMTELAAPTDTPSLEEVRDKIEGRYARALGEAELQSTSVEARMLQVERASIDAEGAARLESIREGLGLPSPSDTPAVEPSKKAPSDGS